MYLDRHSVEQPATARQKSGLGTEKASPARFWPSPSVSVLQSHLLRLHTILHHVGRGWSQWTRCLARRGPATVQCLLSLQPIGSSSLAVLFMSSFRSQALRTATPYGQANKILAGTRSWRPAAAIAGVAAARFNSTSAPSTTTFPAAESDASSGLPPSDGFELDSTDLSALDINAIPEQIGYLKQLGLDFGWGFSATIEYLIEHFHIAAGLPWWGGIVATGIFIRLALLGPTISAVDVGAKTNNIKHLTGPLRKDMMMAQKKSDMVEVAKKRAELSKLHAAHGISAWKSFIPLAQIPFGFGCYRVVNNMCGLPVPGLAAETLGWMQDLTVSDPYFILPVVSAVLMHYTLKKGGEAGMSQLGASSLKNGIYYGLPMVSVMFMATFPAALQLYFVATGAFALGQSYLLNSTTFRKRFGITLVDPNVPTYDLAGTLQKEGFYGLRMVNEESMQEAAKRAAEAQAAERQKMSFIDRTLGDVKETGNKMKQEMREKIDEYRGTGPATNADGSAAQPPRLSEKDRKLADDYEKRRQEEEEWKREERNHARREAYLRTMAQEREKAQASLNRASKANRP
ncbi:membrane insertase OXA1 [Aspergillus ibericus CBS 121593]|uniref:Mitochondrial export translocase Oxa1 n=1 Tax=Aspergillus ibericus CBS 121593 TaxID=1448316 RepID=A0A395H238_9EURO|nr:mitochondrial export translocase Oxa1 [Aspergillus ibericus CBS 121593]RAL01961.1 mitochondrial export translocase Oxa1 [Aspergillus ibericus CBS 121593]